MSEVELKIFSCKKKREILSEYCGHYQSICLKPVLQIEQESFMISLNTERVAEEIPEENITLEVAPEVDQDKQKCSEIKSVEILDIENETLETIEEDQESDSDSETESILEIPETEPPRFFKSFVPCTHQVKNSNSQPSVRLCRARSTLNGFSTLIHNGIIVDHVNAQTFCQKLFVRFFWGDYSTHFCKKVSNLSKTYLRLIYRKK
jgi:hypothetical protein